jgi:hypothetical protein
MQLRRQNRADRAENTHLTTFEDALYEHLKAVGLEPYMEGSG